jgi:phospholipid/cholesterol/gamma-HCH transport system ATP-binding protein
MTGDGLTMTAPTATFHDAVAQAFATQPEGLARLSHAATSVVFRLEGQDDATLLLDREPCQVAGGGEPGEIEIVLSAAQAEAYIAGCLPLTSAIVTGAVQHHGPVRKYLEVDAILRHMLSTVAGGSVASARAEAPDGEVTGRIDHDLLAIETRELHKSFGASQILKGLNLEIPEGVISVILGPSGTGKSVCLQHLIGIMRPDAGDVLIRGRALSRMSRTELLGLRRSIGVMFQDGALFSALNVFENVAFPLRQHTDFNEAEIREIVSDHLDSVGLGGAGQRMPNELSGGMRKRAGLARALALNPGIILVDEPDSGLDPVRTALLGDLLVERHADHGGTMVVVTHNVMLARAIAEHISVLWQGQVLESGMTEQILASETPFIRQFLAGAAHGPLSMDA